MGGGGLWQSRDTSDLNKNEAKRIRNDEVLVIKHILYLVNII